MGAITVPAAVDTGFTVTDVHHHYGVVTALDGVDLTVPGGRAVALVGPDGVGKSTLLALLAGCKTLQAGQVHALGADMAVRAARERVQPRIAYMPQGLGRNLYPNLTVGENISFFAALFGANGAQTRARLAPLLAGTGLAPFEDRLMRKLSGGMKQKLGLCCALVHDPDLLLLDEHNPRSCAFQMAAIENHLRELPRITLAQRSDVARTLAREMHGALVNANPARLSFCESGKRPGLVELTDTIFSDAGLLSDAIADAYFQHASRRRTGAAGHS